MRDKKQSLLVLIIMLLIITSLHYFSQTNRWVLHDFYRRLYYLPIIYGAFKFRLQGGFIVSTLVVLIYAPHMITYFGRINIEVINQFLESGLFMVVGLITGYLVEEDYKRGKTLENQIIKLVNLENYTHNILDSIDSGVIAFNSCGGLQSINRKIENILGDRKDINRFIMKVNLIEDINKILFGNERFIKKEFSYQKDEKQELFLELTIYPIINISNVKEGAVIVLQDLTKVKMLEGQIRRTEGLAAIGQLASGIAHEIRNPLGIIKTISQTIHQDVKDSDLKEALIIIQHEIDRANRVIRSLLDFAKPNKIKIYKININTLMEELVIVTRKLGQQQNVELIHNCNEDFTTEGDIDKLKQAFINIILNGIQAMPLGGKLTISVGKAEDWGVISFKDQGEGISQEVIDKIFNPFFTTKESGTGLGLSITHRIIEEHNGKIEFISGLNEGTEVRVYLPLSY